MIEFINPELFWLLVIPVCIYYTLPAARQMYGDALKVPFLNDISEVKANFKSLRIIHSTAKSSYFKMFLLSMVWALLVMALCRPQWVGEPVRVKNEGRDVLLVMDISTSMLERDFEYQGKYYTRLSVVKEVVSNFIDKRLEDKIGLVLFGTRAYMQVPLTYDKQAVKDVLNVAAAGMAGNSTSIGDAIGVALKNMPTDDSAGKVVILLTDGENNDGSLSMLKAVELAQQENVKVYTIGVGSDETAVLGGLLTIRRDAEIDEESLKKLADATEGTYFRADDVNSLQKVYERINQLEPQKQEGRFVKETKELFYYPASLALLLFMLLILLTRKVW
ncbi:MAG: VWA domain-containing protein [Alphaproteobacteria bacterium]|nr:VWA domain-containing protein [Alphaproteobacteria bacterium]